MARCRLIATSHTHPCIHFLSSNIPHTPHTSITCHVKFNVCVCLTRRSIPFQPKATPTINYQNIMLIINFDD